MRCSWMVCALMLLACGGPDEPPGAKAPSTGETPSATTQPAPTASSATAKPAADPQGATPVKTSVERPAAKPGSAAGDTSASEAYHTQELAGRAGFPPGSGVLVQVPERDRQAMLTAATRFFDAARTEDREAMRDVSTQLFSTNLIDNLDRYRERFFRGLNPSLASAKAGAEAGEVRMPDTGHFEIQVKFPDGTDRRMMMAVESGHWRVNRL